MKFDLSMVNLLLGIVAGITGIIAGILGNVLAINIVYKITKRGKKPTSRPPIIWFSFYSSVSLFVIASALLALNSSQALTGEIQSIPQEPPSYLEFDGSNLKVYAHGQKLLWSKSIGGLIVNAVIVDLDGDLEPEIIIGVGQDSKIPNKAGIDSGKIIVYRSDGTTKWELSAINFAPYPSNVPITTGTVVIEQFIVADLNDDLQKEIIVLTRDLMWYPSKLTVVSSNGTVGGEYWHPGFIYKVAVATTHEDNKHLLVVSAVNNDLTAKLNFSGENLSTIFVLDPFDLTGQAPPYFFGEIEKAHHIWYGYFETPPMIIDIQIREMFQGSDEIVLVMNTGHHLYIDLPSGKIIRTVGGGNGYQGESPVMNFLP